MTIGHEHSIKKDLLLKFEEIFQAERSYVLVEELGIYSGAARIDIAAIDQEFLGIEIKAANDSLARLPVQLAAYDRLISYGYLVTTSNHVQKAFEILPAHWGVVLAQSTGKHTTFTISRVAQLNLQRDPGALARLLWKEEVFFALESIGCSRGMRSKSAAVMQDCLAESVNVLALTSLVARLVRSRADWGNRRLIPTQSPRVAETHT